MIAIGCDHGGYVLKNLILEHLKSKGFEVKDFGINTNESVDYPDYAKLVGDSVAKGECEKGIVICGTGIGISIAANKIKGIRAALCTNSFMARMSIEHNNANVLALGERVIGKDLAIDIVNTFMCAEFEGDRHVKRVNKILDLEK